MTELAATLVSGKATTAEHRRRVLRRAALHAFLLAMAIIWLFPLVCALYTSLRPYEDTGGHPRGYVSIGGAPRISSSSSESETRSRC